MSRIPHCEHSEAIQNGAAGLDCRVAALLAMTIILALSGCGNKGRLKTPSQIAAQEEKKAKKAQKKADDAADSDNSSPLEGEGRVGGEPLAPSPEVTPPLTPPSRGGEK